MPTRRNRRGALLLTALASALAGCSLVLGLADDVQPASRASDAAPPGALDATAADASGDASAPPCVAAAGWHLDCPFGGAEGTRVPVATPAPPVLANRAHDAFLFLATATGDAAVAIGTLDAGGTYDTVSHLGAGIPSVFATTPFSAGLFSGDIVSLVAAPTAATATDAVRDETLFSQGLAPKVNLSALPADLGPCLATAGLEPKFTGFIVNGAGSLTTSDDLFVMANRALDGGAIRPVLLHISGPPISLTPPSVAEIYPGADDDAASASGAPPLALFRCTAQVPLDVTAVTGSLDAWMAGTASDGTGVAELFVDAGSTSPPTRFSLPLVPSSGMSTSDHPGAVFFVGATDRGPGLTVLTIDSPNVHPATVIDTGAIAIVGGYQTVLTPSGVTAVAATDTGTLVFFQWTLQGGANADAGAPVVARSADFGENGLLQVPLPEAFDLGNIAAFDGDFFVSIRLRASGEARLLRLTNR